MTTPVQDTVVEQVAVSSARAAALVAATTAATQRLIVALWARTDPYDPVSVAEFVAQAGKLIVGSQRSVATATAAALQWQLQAAGVHLEVPVSIPDDVRGASASFGRAVKVHAPAETKVSYKDGPDRVVKRAESSPDRLFDRVAQTYRFERSTGADDATATKAARVRINVLTDTNTMLAQRLAEQQALTSVNRQRPGLVTGYRRIVHPELSKGGVCGLCVAASDRTYKVGELKPVHQRCACGISVVTRDHDPGMSLNSRDLRQLYDESGSTSGKDLKRTRYMIEHHDELGPVLTRVRGEKVPYYSTTPPETPIPGVDFVNLDA